MVTVDLIVCDRCGGSLGYADTHIPAFVMYCLTCSRERGLVAENEDEEVDGGENEPNQRSLIREGSGVKV